MLPGRSVAISSCIPRMYAVFGFIIAVASGAWPCVPAPRQSSVSVHGHCSFPFFFFLFSFSFTGSPCFRVLALCWWSDGGHGDCSFCAVKCVGETRW